MTGRYQEYSEYKNSNLEWLGSIPQHWEIRYSKWLFSERNTKATKNDEMLTASQKYGVIPQKEFMRLEQQKVVQVQTGHEILKSVKKNDFVISMRSFQGGIEFCGYDGSVSSAYVPLTPSDEVDLGYFKYLFKSKQYIQALQSTTNLVRDGQALRYSNFVQVKLPLPEKIEQACIANFLDHETAKIDTLISKQQKLLGLLKEKRQAVVSHAVTKGLNPDAEMKDSGVEWLGKVPKHWQVKRLKQLLRKPFLYGANEAALDTNREHPRFIRITDMASDGTLKDETFRSLSPEIAAPYMLENNDILLARSGATVGKSFIYKKEFGDSCFAGYLIKASIKEQLFSPNLIYWFCQSDCYWKNIGGSQIQSTIQNVSAEKYGEIKIPIPPSSTEQDEICSYIEKKTSKIDDLISACITQIDLTNERKTALISAAVTGKIDVRYFKEEVNE